MYDTTKIYDIAILYTSETEFMKKIKNIKTYSSSCSSYPREVQYLCYACQRGWLEAVKYLVKKRYISPQSAYGAPLRKAVQYNQVEVLEWMIQDNIGVLNIDCKDIQEWIFLQSDKYIEFLESQIKLPMDCLSKIMEFVRVPFPFSKSRIKKFINDKVKCRIIK